MVLRLFMHGAVQEDGHFYSMLVIASIEAAGKIGGRNLTSEMS